MPAVTLQKSTTQRSQNGLVLMAFAAERLSVVTRAYALTFDGSIAPGVHPAAGTRIVNAPNIM